MRQRKHTIYSFQQDNLKIIKGKMLNWLKQFNIFSFLDNNQYCQSPNRFECIAAAGVINRFQDAKSLLNDDWLFGHICYEYGRQYFPKYPWKHHPQNEFPLFHFFQPEIVCFIPFGTTELHINCLTSNPEAVLEEIIATKEAISSSQEPDTSWQLDFDKNGYLNQLDKIKKDIIEGDFYELNFCVRAVANQIIGDPISLFQKLNHSNPSPFAAYYRLLDQHLLCASPERFLNKTKNILTAQPIKGTTRRSAIEEEDVQLQTALKSSIKEQAENLMITDLIRNDLAKICEPGSIQVPELLGIYHFPNLHHLISTIQGKLNNNTDFETILKASFPMGSMTGAPKKIVMERIDTYEKQVRNLYSGSIGYIMPNGDFDLNVVIRSLIYSEKKQELSYATGGAITFDSIGELEWQEVNLKAAAMKALFS